MRYGWGPLTMVELSASPIAFEIFQTIVVRSLLNKTLDCVRDRGNDSQYDKQQAKACHSK